MQNLLIDFDGVIGTETKYTGPGGQRAFLALSSRDSQAMRRIVESGVNVVIVTASRSALIEEYARRHGCKCVASNNKLFSLRSFLADEDFEQSVAVGDDVSDIAMMSMAGRAYCPADAHPEVKELFPVLSSPGGAGVVQELEKILKDDKIHRTGTKEPTNRPFLRGEVRG